MGSRANLPIGWLLVTALALVAPTAASGYTTLTKNQRRQILGNADVTSPNGKLIADPACIGGRLSTVNGRWAMVYLTNTNSCVRRYGGASGEAMLLKRGSSHSRDWRIVGSIGDNCSHHEAGASDRVLRDLGCAFFDRPQVE